MRIYYAMEAEGRRCHVRTALGVDARAWNRLHRRVRDWRRELESRCAIPADGPLRPGELLTAAATPRAVLHLRLPPSADAPAGGGGGCRGAARNRGRCRRDWRRGNHQRLPRQGRRARLPTGQPGPALQPDQRHRLPGGRPRPGHLRTGTRGVGRPHPPQAEELQPGAHPLQCLPGRMEHPQPPHRAGHRRPRLPRPRRRRFAPGGRSRRPTPFCGRRSRPLTTTRQRAPV